MAVQILVVEDSTLISSALKVLLEAGGYEVLVADTASAAVETAAEFFPDVLLLDLSLPDADGLWVLGELAARGVYPMVKLAMTGHGDDATRDRCIAAGCDAVLVKPVPARDLLRIIADRVA